ncbi:MAG: DarT ssDNA thymidine ADP-ribosyltransferase family protein [Calditrichota bacterium]
MGLFRRLTIADQAQRRGVILLHSTHLYKNLPAILQDGELHTVRRLHERYGSEHAARFLHDPRRYEQFAVGLDYLNAALSHPNVELLYHRSKTDWKCDWIHFALDLQLLDRDDTLFCPVSAAAEFGKYVVSGVEGFRALFADSVEDHRRTGLPQSVPTHPQAEVLLRGPLPLNVVQSAIVPTSDVAEEVERLTFRHHRTLRIEILPQLFVWPKWLIKK